MPSALRVLIVGFLLAACATPSRPTVWQAFPEAGARVGLDVMEIPDPDGILYRGAVVVQRAGRSARIGDAYEAADEMARFSLYTTPDDDIAVVIGIAPFVLDGATWRDATTADRIGAWRYLGAFDTVGETAPRFYSPAEQSECVDPHDIPSGITVELTDRVGNTCARR